MANGTIDKVFTENPLDYLQYLAQNAVDAVDNIFDVTFYPSDASSDSKLVLSGRVAEIPLPQPKTNTKKKKYKGHEIDVVKSSVAVERKMELTINIDANYSYYCAWRACSHMHGNPENGGSVASRMSNSGILVVHVPADSFLADYSKDKDTNGTMSSVGSSNAITKDGEEAPDKGAAWLFTNCWIGDVSNPTYKTDGDGDSLQFKATLYFGKYGFVSKDIADFNDAFAAAKDVGVKKA